MVAAYMGKNTVKSIQTELEDSNSNYEEFKEQITVVFNKLPRERVKLTCAQFRPGLEKVIEVEGAYFKLNQHQHQGKQNHF